MSAAREAFGNDIICTEEEARAWASNHIRIDNCETIRQFPWSRVFKIDSGDDTAYLKIMPPDTTVSTRLHPLLSRHYPDHVPATIAADEHNGLLLMRQFVGDRMGYGSPDEHKIALVRTYARLQAESANNADILGVLPRTDPEEQLSQLLEFLDPGGDPPRIRGAVIGAEAIVGRKIARRYRTPLLARQELLRRYLSRAKSLPDTINHGDLRAPHASIKSDGNCVLFDWDDATVGPAGLSLHGVFSGCAVPAMLLDGDQLDDPRKARRKRALLDAYIDELTALGYVDRSAIEHGLGASICAGVMQYIVAYSRYDFGEDRARKDIAKIFEKRLSDLLDLCDHLSAGDRASVIEHARDYEDHGRHARAEKMLARHLWNDPNDAQAHALLGDSLARRGSSRPARRSYREAIEIDPRNAGFRCKLGDSLLRDLQFDRAIAQYRSALDADPSCHRATRQLESAFELRRAQSMARRSDVLPRLVVSAEEFERGRLDEAKLALAEQLFRDYGILVMENVFDKDLLEECRAFFMERYAEYFENRRHKDALRIGDKRFQVTLSIEGPFNSAALYGNPLVLPLMTRWLDETFVFGSLTGSTSLPGSEEQWLHKDHPLLFAKDRDNVLTPPFGVSVMIPLIDFNEEVGTTKVKKKSHTVSLSRSRDMRSLSPYVNTGSCYFMDPRLSHKGEPNRSTRVRPLLNMLYHRRWYRDSLNYRNQPPIRISDAEFDKAPDDLKRLLKWTADPAARID